MNLMSEYLKQNWLKLLLLGLSAGVLIYLVRLGFACKETSEPKPGYVVVRDTVTKTEYVNMIEYRDKIVYKFKYIQQDPEVVYVQKYDSVFSIKLKYLEPMLSVSKRRTELDIFAMNPLDSTIKKYTFKNVTESFDAFADSGRITLNTAWYEWRGVKLELSGEYNVSKKFLRDNQGPFFGEHTYKAGIKTGMNFGTQFGIEAGVHYDFINAETSIKASLEYNLIK